MVEKIKFIRPTPTFGETISNNMAISLKNKLLRNFLIVVLLLIFFPSCGSQKGEFAFKYPLDDAFKKIKGRIEFPHDKEIQWAYIYKNKPLSKRIGVILQKKEIVWVENEVRSDFVDMSKKVVFGTLGNLEVGRYKIMLTNIKSQKKIDEFEFFIFDDKKEDEFE